MSRARLIALLVAPLALAWIAVAPAQQSDPEIAALQAQLAQSRANAGAYKDNADAYRKMAEDARQQMDRAATAAADAQKQGDEERRSYWERQQKYWQERIPYHEEQARLNQAKAQELDKVVADQEAQLARLLAAKGEKDKPPPAPAASAPPPPGPSADAKQDKYRPRELAEFVGLWRDKKNNVEAVIEGTDPADPTAGTDIVFKGHKITWQGSFEAGGGDKQARLRFHYKPKWNEMNTDIPEWARRQVDGQLEWKLELEPPDDEFACVMPILKATWHAGEVTWEGDRDSGTATVTGPGEEQKFELDKEDDELELHGYFDTALLLHVGDPQRAMTDPVEFLVQGQRFMVEVHMSKEAARKQSPTAGPKPGAGGVGDYVFDRDYGGAPATVTFRGLRSGKSQTLNLGMALQTRNHPVVRYETREPVTITDQWGVDNKINVEFENGEMVEVSFGAARQQFRYFTSITKVKLASRDEAFQKLAVTLNALLAGPGVNARHRQQIDNVLKLVRNARAFVHDVQQFYSENRELKFLNDRARLAIVEAYYQRIIFGEHKYWFGQDGRPASPDNPFAIRWASEEERVAVYAIMQSPQRTREIGEIRIEGAKAGASASMGLYAAIAYSGLAIAFHSTPVGEAYLAWYGEDIYGNRVDWTERLSAAVGFGVGVASMTATVVEALAAMRDVNRLFAADKISEVNALVDASAGALGGERRVLSGLDQMPPPAAGPGGTAARRRVLTTERVGQGTVCAVEPDSIANLIADAEAALARRAASRRDSLRPWYSDPSFVHRGAEILDAPEDLHSFVQLGPECRLRSADAVEQIVRKHAVNPRANPLTAQTRRSNIRMPDDAASVWNRGQSTGATSQQIGAYAGTDLRARFYNFDMTLSEIADLHESGFGMTLALEMQHITARHQVALYAVEYGPIGRLLKRPKSFTIFDTNFPTKLFKYKACDLDKLLLRKLRPGETRRVRGAGARAYNEIRPGVRELETNIITPQSGTLGGRSQRTVDLFQFR